MLVNNGQCETRRFLIDSSLDELKCYPFIITSDKFNGSWNTFNEIFDRICVSNKTKNVILNVFNLIQRANESQKLINLYHVNVNANLTVKIVT